MLFSQITLPSPSPTESKSLFFTSVSLEGLAQDLQALRVAGEFEDPKYPYQPDDSEDGQRGGLLTLLVALPLDS